MIEMERDELRDELLTLSENLTGEDLDYAIDYLEVERKRMKGKSHNNSVVSFVGDYCEFGPGRVYLLMAIARSKNNPLSSSEELCFREVVRSRGDVRRKYAKLKAIMVSPLENGRTYDFYLYLSANARNVLKAHFNFRGKMDRWIRNRLNGADNHEKFKKLGKYWLSELSKPSSRDETNLLIDVDDDSDSRLCEVKNALADRTEVLAERKTPNGWHLVTNPFNHERLSIGLDIKTDGLLFLEHVNGGGRYGR
ncbi:hypothetical protein AKJ40_03860 [candidate division MSBL1 archaeon SCGC-AAA259M10]|uniref:Uncharacterized protein n=1 Tax=candidate division MSBL1 archaeon SCGC-AAA259M10 TaxID=1698270 RepID=A0A133UY72_9EURY|nr:hypothetical protein AKJ40_03860 [candidate division MSBL1 archaeon SCGC-AAA259M10]